MLLSLFIFTSPVLLDRSLIIGGRKKSWNPERVSSVFTFVSVCVSVRLSVRGLQSTPFDLGTQFLGQVILET